MAAAKLGSFLLLALVVVVVNGTKGKFTSMTNLEKLFYMESDVIALADIFVREEHFAHAEDDDAGVDGDHDFEGVREMMNRGKKLHLSIYNMTVYLSHPVNVLHLTRRLMSDWPTALSVVWNSEPCQKWHIPDVKRRMQNIKRNFPNEDDLKTVALSIAHIQYTEKIKMDDLFAGVIYGHSPLQSVTERDLVDIAWAAYDGGQFLFTTLVAERIFKECNESKRKEGCGELKLYKVAAASYFQINKLKEALDMTNRVLKKVPGDRGAVRSRTFYEGRLKSGRTMETDRLFDTRNIKYYETCRGERTMTAAAMSRLSCTLMPTRRWLEFERVEYHYIDPPILEIHSPFLNTQLDTIKLAGEAMYRKQALDNKYETPNFTQQPPATSIYQLFSTRFLDLKYPLIRPLDIGTVEVRQIGMEGMYFRPTKRLEIPTFGGHVGSFFTFANGNYSGGEFVFPKYKLKIKPNAGNTIFFYATKSTLNICPVSYGTQWLAVQSLFEVKLQDACRPLEDDLWPSS